MTPQQLLDIAVPPHIWLYIAAACSLIFIAALLSWLRLRRAARATATRSLHGRREGPSVLRRAEDDGDASLAEVFTARRAAHTHVFKCHAELVERRPLSEAQWDSDVPAAWTVFRLKPHGAEGGAFQLGLLLPVQEQKAFSNGFLERLEEQDAEPVLQAFGRAVAGPVPTAAIVGSEGGFLEFRTYVDNDRPHVVPGSLDDAGADYWIYAKLFFQDTLEMYLRLNVRAATAEFATGTPAHGEELMRILAATLRPAGPSAA